MCHIGIFYTLSMQMCKTRNIFNNLAKSKNKFSANFYRSPFDSLKKYLYKIEVPSVQDCIASPYRRLVTLIKIS
jgi:hypothetical protein